MDKNIICSFVILILPYLIAGLTGAIIAFIELSSKFSDRMKLVLKSYSSWIYLAINAFASVFLFDLAIIFEIKIAGVGVFDHPYIASIIVGLFSMGLLRTSVISIHIKGNDIGNIIQRMLKWAETLYDRDRTLFLLKEVQPLVKGIPFTAVHTEIIPLCMAAFTYLSVEDSDKINSKISKIKKDNCLIDKIKVDTLALEVAKVVGIDILKQSLANYKANTGQSDNANNQLRLQEQLDKILRGIGSKEEKE
jgi:hypothetical protein